MCRNTFSILFKISKFVQVPFEVRRINFNGRTSGGDEDGHSTLTSEDNSQDCSPLSNSNMGTMQALKVKVLLLGAEDAPRGGLPSPT